MFERVKRTGAVTRRMKQIGHNHIIASRCRAHEAARIGQVQFQSRLPAGSKILRLEARHDGEHFGKEFHAIAFQVRVEAGRSKSNPRAQSQKQSACWRGVKKKRNMGVAVLRIGGQCSAHLKAVVDPKRFVGGDILNDRNRIHDPFPVLD